VRAFLAGFGRAPRRLSVTPLPCWWANLVLLLEADGERLVLRRYGITPPNEVLWELALLRHLGRHGFPTIAPLPRADGAPHGVFDGLPAVLYPYVEGHDGCDPSLDPLQAMAETAATIARLHTLTRDLVLPHPRERSGSDSRRLVDQFLGYVAQRGIAPHERALAALVEDTARQREAFQGRLMARESDLPRGIVHHDAHCRNVLFRGGRLVALIDFDDACPSFLAADLAVLLGSWALRDDPSGERLPLDPGRAARIVGVYEGASPLTGAERELLPDFLLHYLLGDGLVDVQIRLEEGIAAEEAVAGCALYQRFRRFAAGPGWRDAVRRALEV
jgi:Ser/Thr protein kinase RdoA (MazF antagonist)